MSKDDDDYLDAQATKVVKPKVVLDETDKIPSEPRCIKLGDN